MDSVVDEFDCKRKCPETAWVTRRKDRSEVFAGGKLYGVGEVQRLMTYSISSE